MTEILQQQVIFQPTLQSSSTITTKKDEKLLKTIKRTSVSN